MKTDLSAVTLVAVDTRLPQAALSAMRRCMAELQFADAVLVTCADHGLGRPEGVRVVVVPSITSSQAYSRYVIEDLPDLVCTSHVLIAQWDGFVTHPEAWDPSFLDHDYIGAPWPQFKDAFNVGNGGFSLRSHRLMLAARQMAAGQDLHPEDLWLCRTKRPELERVHGIRFAPAAVAQRFAVERSGDVDAAFGCHGLSNMVAALPPAELAGFLLALPPDVYASTECRRLVKMLLARSRWDLAQHALRTRRVASGFQGSDLRLWWRFHAARLRAGILPGSAARSEQS
jgi:Protein of unknown function (DUF5672)